MEGTKVPVIYYLSKNGHLDPPHFIEITLLPGEQLSLRDVISHLDSLRGKGIGTMYSWSCKRTYKNAFVWHDLSYNDIMYPSQGHEYILKGSEILGINVHRDDHIVEKQVQAPKSALDNIELTNSGEKIKKKKEKVASRSFDMNGYKVYKNELSRRIQIPTIQEEPLVASPPFSSSLETVEALIKAHSRIAPVSENDKDRYVYGGYSQRGTGGSMMHLLSCGTISGKLGCGRSRKSPRAELERLPRSFSSSAGGKECKEQYGDIVMSAIKVQGKDCYKRHNGSKTGTNQESGGFSRRLDRSCSYKPER